MFKKFLSFIYLAKIQKNKKYLLSPIIIIKNDFSFHLKSYLFILSIRGFPLHVIINSLSFPFLTYSHLLSRINYLFHQMHLQIINPLLERPLLQIKPLVHTTTTLTSHLIIINNNYILCCIF